VTVATTELDRLIDEPNPTYKHAMMQAYEAYCEANDCTWADFQAERRRLPQYYLAGKMSGIPGFNFPKFDAAALDLRRRGVVILSPAEMDDPNERAMALASPDGIHSGTKLPRSHFLKRDFLIVVEADGVIVLDDWKDSSGALDETRLAFALSKPVFAYPNMQPVRWETHPYFAAASRNGA
jgi:hypothetical protein